MQKIYSTVTEKYKKFKKSEVSYILNKTWVESLGKNVTISWKRNEKIMIFAECDVCYSEKNRSIKKQEPKRLLIKIPIVDDMVFRWVADLGDIFSKSFFVFSLGL